MQESDPPNDIQASPHHSTHEGCEYPGVDLYDFSLCLVGFHIHNIYFNWEEKTVSMLYQIEVPKSISLPELLTPSNEGLKLRY